MRLSKTEGDPVRPGDLLGRVHTDVQALAVYGDEVQELPEPLLPTSTQQNASSGAAADSFSPAVRRLLREHKLDFSQVPKRGRGERLSIEDVEVYLASRRATPGAPAKPTQPRALREGRKVLHTPMRRSIAAHMTRSILAAPHVTSVFEADLSAVLRDREARKETAASGGVPSITAYLIQAALQAMKVVPEVNSRWHEEYLEVFDWVNFGVGTALDTGGLVVPVIRDAHAMDLLQISNTLRELTSKARSGKLTHAEMEGGTFTLSNHGVSGSLLAAPIILPHGQAAILGAGKLQKRVIVCETGGRELFRVRPMMYVTLTVDHRVLDGQQTNGFLTRFVEALENPLAS